MTTATLNAIDLSNFTGDITDAIAQCWWTDGVRHAIIGCQDVTIATQQATVLLGNGFTVDLYAFMYWGLSTLPEIDKCIAVARAVGLVPGQTRIWLDCEAQVPNEQAGMTPANREGLLALAVSYVESHGFLAGIYSGIYYWQDQMGNATQFAALPFWLAEYFNDHRLVDTVSVGGWTQVAMHQFEGSTNLCGVDVDEDEDIVGVCNHTQPDPPQPQEGDMDYQVRRMLVRGQLDPQTEKMVDVTDNAAVDRVMAALDLGGTSIVGSIYRNGANIAVLNAAVMMREDIANVASGPYANVQKAHDALKAAGLIQ